MLTHRRAVPLCIALSLSGCVAPRLQVVSGEEWLVLQRPIALGMILDSTKLLREPWLTIDINGELAKLVHM